MAKVIVLGVAGEEGLWIADLENGTVLPLDVATSDALSSATALRKAGCVITKNVDVAIAVTAGTDVASGVLEVASGVLE